MSPCPSEESLSSWISGRMSVEAAAALQAHLSACDDCRLVADVLQTDRPVREPSLRPGQRLGPYEVLEWLGSGGMGAVYAAHDTKLDRRIALKVLCVAHEARAMARLNHPNVATVFDAGAHDGVHWLAMELLPGGTLRRWLREPRGVDEVLEVFAQIARGLAHAHAHGLVHRDFKPDNVLFTEDGTPRVADFGLAAEPGRRREVAGTWAYLAPEARRGEHSAAADQYAFGVTLRQALEGRRAPRSVTALVTRMTATEPEHRFPSMTAVEAALRGARSQRRVLPALALTTAAAATALAFWPASTSPARCNMAPPSSLRAALKGIELCDAHSESSRLAADVERAWTDPTLCEAAVEAQLQRLVASARRDKLPALEARAWTDLARCQRQRGHVNQAAFSLTVADEIARSQPRESLVRPLTALARAKLLIHLARYDEAAAALAHVQATAGWLEGMRLSRQALLELARQRPEHAVELYQRALPLLEQSFGPDDPESRIARHNLASSLTAAFRYEEALALLERAVREAGGEEHVGTPLASDLVPVLLGLGRDDEALKWARHALAGVDPSDLRTISSMGQQLHAWARAELAAGDPRAVLERLEKLRALETYSDAHELHAVERRVLEAEALLTLGRVEPALKLLESVQPNADQRQLWARAYAQALVAAGRPDDAAAQLAALPLDGSVGIDPRERAETWRLVAEALRHTRGRRPALDARSR